VILTPNRSPINMRLILSRSSFSAIVRRWICWLLRALWQRRVLIGRRRLWRRRLRGWKRKTACWLSQPNSAYQPTKRTQRGTQPSIETARHVSRVIESSAVAFGVFHGSSRSTVLARLLMSVMKRRHPSHPIYRNERAISAVFAVVYRRCRR
jgi:hypothetical protein